MFSFCAGAAPAALSPTDSEVNVGPPVGAEVGAVSAGAVSAGAVSEGAGVYGAAIVGAEIPGAEVTAKG